MQGAVYHRPHARALRLTISGREALKRAAPYIGTPYKRHGQEPATGWDCWGCVRYLRREIFGLESPSWAEVYSVADVNDLEKVEGLIRKHLDAWRPVEVRPGAALLFEIFGRGAHCGLMLTATEFVHSLAGQETTLVRLDDSRWVNRLRGAYDTAANHHRTGAVHSSS